jgi:hypothetical protein
LIFNLDEVGMSEWEDRKEKKVIIPMTMDGQTIHHGISRSVRHISVIACISAGGESLTSFIVTSQISDGIRKRLMDRGVRLGFDLVLRQRSKPYVSRELFLKYITKIFLPYLNELQESEEFEACEAVFLMDNCSPHVSDEVVAVLTNARVRIIIFAHHTAHIFQMLDVVLFGTLKKHANGLKMFDEEQPAVAFLLRVYRNFKQTMIEVNIWVEPLQPLDSLMISTKVYTDYSSMSKSSDKVPVLWNSESAIRHWRVCRGGGKTQSLDGSTNRNKSI